ncbi:MAG: hypothetical protein ACFFDW_01025 [Candidatus Thorarchaeota archaeon]
MAKVKIFGLIAEIVAILAGIAMFLVGYLVFEPGVNTAFMLLAIGGGVFIIAGLALLVIDIIRMGKKESTT